MEYRVNFGFQAFAVPSVVVDNLIKLAKENHLKVLLYLTRYSEQNFTSVQIANALKLNIDSVEEALEFWTNFNVLQDTTQPVPHAMQYAVPSMISLQNNNNNNNNIINNTEKEEKISVLEPIKSTKPEIIEDTQKPAKNTDVKIKLSQNTSEELARLSTEDISKMIENSKKLRDLVEKSQEYFGYKQYDMQIRSLIWMHEYLGMDSKIILILLAYCKEVNKLNIRYLDKIAFQWWEDEILTEEDAKNQVQYLTEFYTDKMNIKRLFEMGSNPTKAQIEFIERWQSVGYSEELLLYAHDLTVESIAKKNFKYIDKILQSWSDAGIKTLEQAQKIRDEFLKKYEKTKGRKKGKSKNTKDKFTKEELEGYLSLVNRLEED